MIIVPPTLYPFNASWFPSFVQNPRSTRCLCMQEKSHQLASVLASLFSTPQPAIGLPDTGISNRKSDMSKCPGPDYPNLYAAIVSSCAHTVSAIVVCTTVAWQPHPPLILTMASYFQSLITLTAPLSSPLPPPPPTPLHPSHRTHRTPQSTSRHSYSSTPDSSHPHSGSVASRPPDALHDPNG